jgi:uncharacterized protein (DUF302 family)
MKDHKTEHAGEPVGAHVRSGTNLPCRILVIDGDMGVRQSSAEVLIRHETKLLENSVTEAVDAVGAQVSLFAPDI